MNTTAVLVILVITGITILSYLVSKSKKTGGQGNGIAPSDPPQDDKNEEKPY